MSLMDFAGGFWFGLGCAPVIGLCVVLLRYLESKYERESGTQDAKRREEEAFQRGLKEGIRADILNRAIDKVDERIIEKIGDIRTRGEPHA